MLPCWAWADMVHLRSSVLNTVVAVAFQQRPEAQPKPRRRPLELIQGSLSARRVERQSPWLGRLHRIADGTLAGLGLAMVGLSALTLHWQGQWTQNFQKLEAGQRLEHRLQESAAVLEQHHLGQARKPGMLVPTSSEKLVYLAPPQQHAEPAVNTLLASVSTQPIFAGY